MTRDHFAVALERLFRLQDVHKYEYLVKRMDERGMTPEDGHYHNMASCLDAARARVRQLDVELAIVDEGRASMTDTPVHLSDCFTIREVAAFLDVRPGLVRWWIMHGRMRAIHEKPYLVHRLDAVLPERGIRGPDVKHRPARSGAKYRGK
jgi:hypothetical protein